MAGAAGGSGIAALAQSMANQGAINASKSAASIGQQESANQKIKYPDAQPELQVLRIQSYACI